MNEISIHAGLILRHLATAKLADVPILEFVRFFAADGLIVGAKDAARRNAEAIEELIKRDLVNLWVIDRGDHENGSITPELVLIMTGSGRALAAQFV